MHSVWDYIDWLIYYSPLAQLTSMYYTLLTTQLISRTFLRQSFSLYITVGRTRTGFKLAKGLLSCCLRLLFILFSIQLVRGRYSLYLIVGRTSSSNYPLIVLICKYYKTRFICRGFRFICNPGYFPCCEIGCKLSFDCFSFVVLFWPSQSEFEHLRLKEGLGLEDWVSEEVSYYFSFLCSQDDLGLFVEPDLFLPKLLDCKGKPWDS